MNYYHRIWKEQISKEEFTDYIKHYPRKLVFDYCGIGDPAKLTWNDPELGDIVTDGTVASFIGYDEDPDSPRYGTDADRNYKILLNHEEIYNYIKAKQGEKA